MNSFFNKPELVRLTYKIWCDCLILLLAFFGIFLAVEAVLSGVFYSPLNLSYLSILIIFWVILGDWLGSKITPAIQSSVSEPLPKFIINASLAILAIFLIWSTLKFTWYEALVIVLTSIAIYRYLFEIILNPKKD